MNNATRMIRIDANPKYNLLPIVMSKTSAPRGDAA
jgi:hypothetical protein